MCDYMIILYDCMIDGRSTEQELEGNGKELTRFIFGFRSTTFLLFPFIIVFLLFADGSMILRILAFFLVTFAGLQHENVNYVKNIKTREKIDMEIKKDQKSARKSANHFLRATKNGAKCMKRKRKILSNHFP